MKKVSILVVICLLGQLALGQQAQQQLDQAISTWRMAVLAADEATLKALVADELSYGHSNGKIENKAEFVSVIVSKENVYKRLDLSEQTISMVDKNTAIVRHKMAVDVVSHGEQKSFYIGVLQVWIKRKNTWQMMARQAFKL